MDPVWLFLVLALVVVIAVALVAVVVSARKTVRRQQERLDAAWTAITGQISARSETLAELRSRVETVAGHERSRLTDLNAAVADLETADDAQDASRAEDRVQGGIRELLHVAEGYPDLQRDKDFLRLQGELAREGGEIQTARRQYNGTVREYNTKIRTFPGALVARSLGASPRPYFEVADRAAISAPPKVQF
ncbi:membrane protein [Pseudoclavibacter endophyticus]|uniref:LemA family protein n=1 Tax=Pseudoclavibacter endophyticus TaxID=1778590 RepID=A0A6H9WRW1_9MICO|nr:LemA family protein [Pseudoclavibacter endophyticus]KAB1649677.1 LemA family protein [Pseudoclavibacter endophyticus]GGA60668.1 membrane protein [Pseudoclavibacter endophyticus]